MVTAVSDNPLDNSLDKLIDNPSGIMRKLKYHISTCRAPNEPSKISMMFSTEILDGSLGYLGACRCGNCAQNQSDDKTGQCAIKIGVWIANRFFLSKIEDNSYDGK